MSDFQIKKRKRAQNTTTEQYEMYLDIMENDYVFRSNTINPTLDADYLVKKWEKLTFELNSIGTGPELSIEEWKKRFKDWKYATKAKFRKISEHAKKTGAGPKLNLEMTPIEERALCVWGKITVTGSNVTAYEGIDCEPEAVAPEIYEIPNNENVLVLELENHSLQSEIIEKETTPTTSLKKFKESRGSESKRAKPLSALAEHLLENSDNANIINKEVTSTLKEFCKEYLEIEKEKLSLERDRLVLDKEKVLQDNEKVLVEKQKMQFEIAKFKYMHRDFQY